MKNNVLILGDNNKFCKELLDMIYHVDYEIRIYFFNELENAMKCVREKNIDVFLINERLDSDKRDEKTGLNFARRIRALEEYFITPIILLSTKEDLEIEMLHNISFVLYYRYPLQKEKLQIVFEKILKYSKNEEKKVILKSRGLTFSVKMDDIVYGEIYERVFRLQTKKQMFYIPYFPMNQFIKCIHDYPIYQCHRSFVINMNYIAYIDEMRKKIFLKESFGKIELGHSYKKSILEAFEKES